MIAAATSEMRAPVLESGAARLGVLVLVVLSAVIGFQYWLKADEPQLAVVTIAAEIIAFAGLMLVRWNWDKAFGWAVVGLVLTLLAAAWCGMTMYEKIAADGRVSALTAAQATLPYQTAARDFTEASTALRHKLAEAPPACTCPETIRSWESSQAASVTRLTAARDAAEDRLAAATPPAQIDILAIVRGVGVELIKLLGFAAFGLLTPLETPRETVPRRSGQSLWSKALAWLGIATMGLGFGAIASAETRGPIAPATETPPVSGNVITIDVKTRVFSLYDTGAYTGPGWAERLASDVGASRSSVYRWLAKRDAVAA